METRGDLPGFLMMSSSGKEECWVGMGLGVRGIVNLLTASLSVARIINVIKG